MNLETFETDQLAEMRGQVRMNVAKLERLGATRTVAQDQELREQRALMRRLTIVIKQRITQIKLF